MLCQVSIILCVLGYRSGLLGDGRPLSGSSLFAVDRLGGPVPQAPWDFSLSASRQAGECSDRNRRYKNDLRRDYGGANRDVDGIRTRQASSSQVRPATAGYPHETARRPICLAGGQ